MPYICHKFIIHTSQLNKMDMDIKFNDEVHLHENPYLSTLYAIQRSRYYPHLRKHYLRPNNTTPGHIHIRSVARTLDIWSKVADIEFRGPRHTSVWKSVPISFGAHWSPKTAYHLGMTNLGSYSRKWYHRKCLSSLYRGTYLINRHDSKRGFYRSFVLHYDLCLVWDPIRKSLV